MTVTVNDRRREYPGNDVATVFAGPRAFATSHIYATLTEDTSGASQSLENGVDYEVTGLGLAETVVTLAAAPATGYTLTLLRTLPIEQNTRFTNQGAFFAGLHEDQFDWVTMILQQIADDLEQFAGISLEVLIDALLVNQDFIDLLTQLITNTFSETDYILQLGMLRYLIPIKSIATATATIDKTYESALVLCTAAEPVEITLRENDGSALADFSTGAFVSFKQTTVGGQVSLVPPGGGAFTVPTGFLAKTRALNSIITATCELAAGGAWALSGDLAIDPSASVGQAVTALAIDAGVVAVDCSLGDFFTLDLTEDVTDWDITNEPAAGYAQHLRIRIRQHAASAKTVAWPAAFKWSGAAPSVSTDLGAYDYLAAITFDQGARYEAALSKGFA